ncbi:hypothetical protein [Humidisolicoccus flavus]|uniref:hypothetical protein n=1 Tax=Humidisolicoccus flavus TaxID=3111414 RepID=UPI0032475562
MTDSLTSPRPALLPRARGIIGVAVGVPIAFIQDHSILIGLLGFAIFAALTAVAMLVFGRGTRPGWPFIAGAASGIAAIAAVALVLIDPSNERAFTLVLAAWALVAGGAEAFGWLRARSTVASDRDRRIVADWRMVAILTIIYGLGMAFLNLGPVPTVGTFGAYAVIVGVFTLIASFSARPIRRAEQPSAPDSTGTPGIGTESPATTAPSGDAR